MNAPYVMKSKWIPGIGLAVCLTLVGFVVGLFVGGAAVPENSGLAGGAIVFFYGLVGAAVALVFSIVLAVKLSRPMLVRVTWWALAVMLAAVAVLVIRARYAQKERDARRLEEELADRPRPVSPPPVRVEPLPQPEPPSVESLALQLLAADQGVRSKALTMMGRLTPGDRQALADILVQELPDSDAERCTLAAGALDALGPDAAATAVPLARLIVVRQDHCFLAAAVALSQLRDAAGEAVALFIEVVEAQREEDLQRQHGPLFRSLKALEILGPTAEAAVPALVDRLEQADPYNGIVLATTLAQIRPVEAVSHLLHIIADDEVPPRIEAVRLLGEVGPAAEAAVPALIGLLADANERVREGAAAALQRIGTPEALEAVEARQVP